MFRGLLMNDIYVHTLRYHYYGDGSRHSRTTLPISFGPFKDPAAAREWIRLRRISRATNLRYRPAQDNIKVTLVHPRAEEIGEYPGDLLLQIPQISML